MAINLLQRPRRTLLILSALNILASAASGQQAGNLSAVPDFTGVWTAYIEPGQSPFGALMGPPPKLPFTKEGQRRRDEYQKLALTDNPGAYCVTYGMPTMMEMAGSYPIEFIQKPDQFTMIYEVESETRRVYFGDRNVSDEKRLPSRQGYSSGRWDGRTLVIETTNLTDGVDQFIHPRSDQAKITERFELSEDQAGKKIISYEMIIVDPVYYTEPVSVKKKWTTMIDGHIMPYNCTEEPWLRLLKLRRKQLTEGKPVVAKMSDVIDVYE